MSPQCRHGDVGMLRQQRQSAIRNRQIKDQLPEVRPIAKVLECSLVKKPSGVDVKHLQLAEPRQVPKSLSGDVGSPEREPVQLRQLPDVFEVLVTD